MFKRLPCLAVLAVLVVGGAASCRVASDDIAVTRVARPESSRGGVPTVDGLPVLGPIPASSHWHAAYVVRICDDVLPPFESDADPLGIHSHADGVIHVHPFFVESGYEAANLGLFADAMGFGLREGELTLPGGGTWRDGDLCDGVPGRVFVDRWRMPDPESEVERIFSNPDKVRYLADGELYQIAFAPIDSFPVVPPSSANLSEYSNLAPPGEPWVDVDARATLDQVTFWPIQEVGIEPCEPGLVPERVRFGDVRCFGRGGEEIAGSEAVTAARAVFFNREPAVELRITPALQQLIAAHFAVRDDPLALAVEIDAFVVTAPLIPRPPVSDRLVVSGGLTAQAALDLAAVLSPG